MDDVQQTAGADPDPMQLFVGCHAEIREGIALLEALARPRASMSRKGHCLDDLSRMASIRILDSAEHIRLTYY